MLKKMDILKIGIFLASAILIADIAFAFGVASENAPISGAPGETKTAVLWLQNMVSEEDITIKAEITKGADIASIKGDPVYIVKSGTKDTEVHVKVKIPEDAPIGTIYTITVSFLTVTAGQESGVAFGTGIDKSFQVLVVSEKTEEPAIKNSTLLLIAAAIIIIIAIVIILLKKKKKK
jgi:hypothetical protein